MRATRWFAVAVACAALPFAALPFAACGGADDADAVAVDTSTAPDLGEADTETSDVLDTAEAPPDAVADDAADADVNEASDVDDAGDDVGDAGEPDAEPDADVPAVPIGELCFSEILDPSGQTVGPEYDAMAPTVGAHCLGTDHQEIVGVERVVVLGDSVSQGTPNLAHLLPTDNAHFWRNLLAEWLADRFDLDRGDAISWGFWKSYNPIDGTAGLRQAGDFHNCSKWGARNDDLLEGGAQIPKCFPDGGSAERTLVVFTMGGNDVAAITRHGGEADEAEVAAGYPTAWAMAHSAVDYLRDGVAWLTDPARFPNGSYVIFANPFEFTDGTGEVGACPVAGLAGLEEWAQPEVQAEIVIWMLERYMEIAVAHGVDLVWMLEHFCGHGWVATGPSADTSARCYRGPDAERWFDETCIHPNAAGHQAIYEMFRAVVEE